MYARVNYLACVAGVKGGGEEGNFPSFSSQSPLPFFHLLTLPLPLPRFNACYIHLLLLPSPLPTAWTPATQALEFILKNSKHWEAGLKRKSTRFFIKFMSLCLRDSWFSETLYLKYLSSWMKLLSLYTFHRIIFILLIVSSLSRNFNRCAACFQSYINIACRLCTQNDARVNIKRF